MSDAAAREALVEPQGVGIDTDAFDLVVEHSQRYAYFVQLWGEALWNRRLATGETWLTAALPAVAARVAEYYQRRYRELESGGLVPVKSSIKRQRIVRRPAFGRIPGIGALLRIADVPSGRADPRFTTGVWLRLRRVRCSQLLGCREDQDGATPAGVLRAAGALVEAAATSGGGGGVLAPWRVAATPHQDVASGRYQQAEFAADLWQVHLGEGADEYRDPHEFFRRTFLTESLKGLLATAVRRLAGRGGDPVVQLQTNFGGGKTHSMLALYHLFSGGGGAGSCRAPTRC